jgi:hypothetical protein
MAASSISRFFLEVPSLLMDSIWRLYRGNSWRYPLALLKFLSEMWLFSRERSSTGSNDCFVVVLVVVVVVGIFIL